MKAARIAGVVLHVLVGGLMILAGSGKAFGFAPADVVEGLTNNGLGDKVALIGFGELIAAALMILPWTSTLGAFVTSGFWGGVILFHMVTGQSYGLPAGFLMLTWLGAALRHPAILRSLAPARLRSPVASPA